MKGDAMNVPAGPRVPRLIAGHAVLLNHVPTLRKWQKKYGDVYTVKLPIYGRSAVILSPELVKRMFTGKPDELGFGDSPLGQAFGPGSLFALDGDEHLRERRLLLPPFHGERMRSYESIIQEEAERELARWKDDVEFESMPSFMTITLNAILRAVFGAEGQNQQRLASMLPRMTQYASLFAIVPFLQRDLGPGSPGRKFAALRREYDAIVSAMIDDVLADAVLEERADVLALLVRARYDDGSAMSRSAIADELFALLAAGHETTATTLGWGVERLRRHPEIYSRLREEALAGGKELRLATINEIQRVRPVIHATDRGVLVRDFEFGDWRLPKGYRIMAMASLIHADERFFERPDEFDPDRFVGVKPDTYTWIPFGGGSRRCIGAAFAQMEMDVVLRTLVTEFELVSTDQPDEKWKSRGIAFAPSRGGLAIVRRSGVPTTKVEGDVVAAA
jgi:cytochrome P450 family 138